mgnify:CR=1 FL=1
MAILRHNFLHQNFFTSKFLTPNLFTPKRFLRQKRLFYLKNIFTSKNAFLTPKNIFYAKHFSRQKFFTIIFFESHTNIENRIFYILCFFLPDSIKPNPDISRFNNVDLDLDEIDWFVRPNICFVFIFPVTSA